MTQVDELQRFNPQSNTSGIHSQSLTEDQKASLREILAKYDPENFSNIDRGSMRRDMRMAALYPSRELFQILEEAGFSRPANKTIPGTAETIDTSRRPDGTLMELLQQFKIGGLSEQEFASEVEQVKQRQAVSIGEMIDSTIA